MSHPNAQQIEYWNGPTGEKWAKLQERIDLNLNDITDALIPFVNAKKGERILDIGCGCGTTTLRLAMIAGRDGSAAGVDISAPMLTVARARAQAMLAKVVFVEADASTHDFQPVHDLVVSRFGVMFFEDPVAAFANIRKAVAPKGRLAFICWRALAENIWAAAPLAAAKDLLPAQDPVDPHAPGPFAFADGERLKGVLSKAGFHNIQTNKLDTVMNMGATVDAAVVEALNIGPLSRAAAELDEAQREKVRARIRGVLEKFVTSRGVVMPAACWLVGATV
jgi:SAM-dependent methyltransferase